MYHEPEPDMQDVQRSRRGTADLEELKKLIPLVSVYEDEDLNLESYSWKDPEVDPTGCELLKDECMEWARGKKTLHECSMLAQLCICEWKEDEAGKFVTKKGGPRVLNRR